MYLFAPTYVPPMHPLAQPSMAPSHVFGVATPAHFGPMRGLRTPLINSPAPPLPIPRSDKVECMTQAATVEPLMQAPRIDRYDAGG